MTSSLTTAAPVIAWRRRDDDTVWVSGATGFGSGVHEAPEAKWDDVVTGANPHVLLLGQPEYREIALASLIESYRVANPTIDVTVTVDGVGVLEELALAFSHLRPGSIRERPIPRLVVAEVTDSYRERLDAVVTAIATRGRTVGWSLLLTAESLAGFENEAYIRANVETVFVLDPLEPSPLVGSGIAAALRGGVRTTAGVEEVVRGALPEWVVAFERAPES